MSIDRSAGRSGIACGFGAAAAGPPKPPSPRRNPQPVTSARSFPEDFSRTSRVEYISAPFPTPLSISASIRVTPTTVPEAGSGS
jgi:hypothetical protein